MLKEDPYLDFVICEARNQGKLFIIDTGEGRGFIDDTTGWHVEDLSGWLININDKENLLRSRENKTAYDVFSDEYVFAVWSRDETGNLVISFNKY